MIKLPDEVMAIVTKQAAAAGVTPVEWLVALIQHADAPLDEAGHVLVDDGGFFPPDIPAQVRRAAQPREVDVA
jgi:hypothetical protein